MLVAMLEGQWHNILTESHMPVYQAGELRLQRNRTILRSLQTFTAGIAPAGIFFGAKLVGVAIPAVIDGYVSVAALIWLSVAIIVALDPTHGTKVSTFKDVMSALLGMRKGENHEK